MGTVLFVPLAYPPRSPGTARTVLFVPHPCAAAPAPPVLKKADPKTEPFFFMQLRRCRPEAVSPTLQKKTPQEKSCGVTCDGYRLDQAEGRVILSSFAHWTSVSRAYRISSSVCSEMTLNRSRASPFGTAGKTAGGTQTFLSRMALEST